MNRIPAVLPADAVPRLERARTPRANYKPLLSAIVVLLGLFSVPLWQLARFAFQSDLYSYILLIPVISVYLIWGQRRFLARVGPADRLTSIVAATAGIALILAYAAGRLKGAPLTPEASLAATTLAFVLLLIAVSAWFLAREVFRKTAFPLALLGFMTPIPPLVLSRIELVLQHGSAVVADFLFNISGTTVFYQNLHFQLPGIVLQVAPECSGIRSSLVLLIVSVVTGYLFLRSPPKRTLFTLAVVPLALLRNGFRIFVIGELCVHVGPEMLDSPFHHRGGPIFFALSLIPLVLLLRFFMQRELPAAKPRREAASAGGA